MCSLFAVLFYIYIVAPPLTTPCETSVNGDHLGGLASLYPGNNEIFLSPPLGSCQRRPRKKSGLSTLLSGNEATPAMKSMPRYIIIKLLGKKKDKIYLESSKRNEIPYLYRKNNLTADSHQTNGYQEEVT